MNSAGGADGRWGAGAGSRTPRNWRLERVGPAQCGEAGEVTVSGVENAAVLDRQRSQIGVTDQRTANLAVQQHLPKQAPVLISGWQKADAGLLQPLIDDLGGFLRREPLSGKSGVRNNSEEGGHRLPW